MLSYESLGLATLLLPLVALWHTVKSSEVQRSLLYSGAIGAGAGLLTWWLVPLLKSYFLKAGLKGRDLGKKGLPGGDTEIPESLGLVAAIVYLVAIILGQVVFYTSVENLLAFNSSLLTIALMVMLGFVDDVVDLPWRYKLILPTVASLPLLCAYTGVTWVRLPKVIAPLLMTDGELTTFGQFIDPFMEVDRGAAGSIIQLGILLYGGYMCLLCVFATNSINIYAGINGLEVGQTVVIGVSVLMINLFELGVHPAVTVDHQHMHSVHLLCPLVGVALGLLYHNWAPATVFVGDVFCYFAGVTCAVACIQGHFSKTMLLCLLPQIFNFLYSIPQLFKLYPCPRHRLPRFDASLGMMVPSTFTHNGQQHDNLTLINLVLRVAGPMTERQLVLCLLGLQYSCATVAIFLRYRLGLLLYGRL